MYVAPLFSLFFFFNDTATTEIYTLSLHDALPISGRCAAILSNGKRCPNASLPGSRYCGVPAHQELARSEEHTSELQSRLHLVCRLLLEKKKKKENNTTTTASGRYSYQQ